MSIDKSAKTKLASNTVFGIVTNLVLQAHVKWQLGRKIFGQKNKSYSSWINIVKIVIIPKVICRFNSIPIKIPGAFFTDIAKKRPKIYMEPKMNWIDKGILGKINIHGSFVLSDIKLYYKAVVIKTLWCWHKNRHTDQFSGSPEINKHSQLIFDKGTKNTQWGKDSLSNKWYWKSCIITCRRVISSWIPISHLKKLNQNGLKT